MNNYITKLNIDSEIHDFWLSNKDLEKTVMIEELSELVKELTKSLRNIGNRENIIEELTDILILSQAIQDIFKIENLEIQCVKLYKEQRLLERIKNKEF